MISGTTFPVLGEHETLQQETSAEPVSMFRLSVVYCFGSLTVFWKMTLRTSCRPNFKLLLHVSDSLAFLDDELPPTSFDVSNDLDFDDRGSESSGEDGTVALSVDGVCLIISRREKFLKKSRDIHYSILG